MENSCKIKDLNIENANGLGFKWMKKMQMRSIYALSSLKVKWLKVENTKLLIHHFPRSCSSIWYLLSIMKLIMYVLLCIVASNQKKTTHTHNYLSNVINLYNLFPVLARYLSGRHKSDCLWSSFTPFPTVNVNPSALPCSLYFLSSEVSQFIILKYKSWVI